MIGAMKLQPDDEPRSSLGIRPSSDDAVGSRRHSLGDSLKGSRSSLGTRREIGERRPEDSAEECRRLLDWWESDTLKGSEIQAVSDPFAAAMSLKGSRLRVGSSHGGDYDDGDHQSSPQIRSRLQGLQLHFLMGAGNPISNS
ncbi:hypothetical protein B296_00033214 [Ensete ventricosum]|uniref:Uncharacterized protein n=1 Tax=Ensete ventricosum TaxID=4639 RepID=A0A426YSF4_ENSVE|nr:hypothetical protein B296_00033214 [Ensete ventricosum]